MNDANEILARYEARKAEARKRAAAVRRQPEITTQEESDAFWDRIEAGALRRKEEES